ncbi:prolyl oligopeptidase family protein [Bacteroidota bacterium]
MIKQIAIAIILFFNLMNVLKAQDKIEYPETKKGDVVDKYFGKKIADPYRWLEDDNSKETIEWVNIQNELTNNYLLNIPYRDKIEQRLSDLWNYEKRSVPFKGGLFYFYFRNDGMQNQDVLFYQEGINGDPRILLDPNKLSEDGTIAISAVSVSKDGRYAAISFSKAGSDWNYIQVINVLDVAWLEDKIEWVKFSQTSWYGEGFFYSRYEAPSEGDEYSGENKNHKLYFHKLGTPQSEDRLIYENQDQPQRNYYCKTTFDEQYLIIYESETTSGNALYVKNLRMPDSKIKQIVDGFEFDFSVIDNIDESLLVRTNFNAPNYQLVLIDPNNPEPLNWTYIIREKKEEVLESASIAENKIVCTYIKDAYNKLYVYEPNGQFNYEVKLPGIGTVSSFSGEKEIPEAFYLYTSFTSPSSIFQIDLLSNNTSIFWSPDLNIGSDNYETKQIFYKSKDGTKIPMFIVHKKGLQLNGENPTMLYGYGGFNISLTPSFRLTRLILLEAGGIYAVANIRGGGEYGEAWHKAGIKENKQNVFDDFIAAAEYLIDHKYTSSEKLAIAGGSNGGLLVGACMTQRPELFKVAIPIVGVLDMLRFHKFTIGWAWVGDYGSSDNKKDFKYLIKYSPLHNINSGIEYPATMVLTGDHDDRVVPAHSFKFIATLQEKNTGKNPVLIRVETDAGHGAGKPTNKQIEEATDMLSFMFYNLGFNGIGNSSDTGDIEPTNELFIIEKKEQPKPTIKLH